MTPDELKKRMPLAYPAYPKGETNVLFFREDYAKAQRASDWAAFARLVREVLGPEEPLMADLVAVYERGTALADALEAAAQEKEAING